jgi:hypothetical protein
MHMGQFDRVLSVEAFANQPAGASEPSKTTFRRARQAALREIEELERDIQRMEQGQALLRNLRETNTSAPLVASRSPFAPDYSSYSAASTAGLG